MKMNEYITLGRSGLRVSPLCLGTMTFGNDRWGSADEESRAIFDRYVEAGGNFVDTADGYAVGQSETVLGRFVAERKLRDRLVVATKFTFGAEEGNPNAGGNGRKNVYRALDGSLRRLGMDYVDLYWMHAWDKVTPVEEVIETLSDLIRAGKIRYYAFSDVPAWYVARAVTLAECHGVAKPVALQLEYSLVERTIEREHIPAAQELGLAICPWSPLASGFLSGKYRRDKSTEEGKSRLDVLKNAANPVFDKFTERNWKIVDVLQRASTATGYSMAQVALHWVATRPGVTSTLIGATRRQQLEDNLAALEIALPAEWREELDRASALEPAHPYMFFDRLLQDRVHGGVAVHKWPRG
uniref:Aldo/keto reductase n=1 Tax=Acidobacterium capsulatum TaxID=33075 RepID=A0A7V5CTR6_9BACT